MGHQSTPWRVEWLYYRLSGEWVYKFSFLELRVRYLRHTRIPKTQESKSHITSGYVSSKSHNSATMFSAREFCSRNCNPLPLSGLEKQPYTTLMVASPKPHPFIMILSGEKMPLDVFTDSSVACVTISKGGALRSHGAVLLH